MEVAEEPTRLRGVVALAIQLRDPAFLFRDMPFALRNMALGFLKVLLEHFAVHKAA